MTSNPFDPYTPDGDGYFGRDEECQSVKILLNRTAKKASGRLLLLGPRGSGKSSLLRFIKKHAENEEKLACFYFSIAQNTTTEGFFSLLIDQIEQIAKKHQGLSEKATALGNKILKKLGGMKVEYRGLKLDPGGDSKSDQKANIYSSMESIVGEFCSFFEDLVAHEDVSTVSDEKQSTVVKGLVLLIDEADMASADLQLGALIKVFSEILEMRGVKGVSIIVGGLPDLKHKLLAAHGSSLRAFQVINLRPINRTGLDEVLDYCCRQAEGVGESVTISSPARERLIELSEGFPHWLRHFAAEAYTSVRRKGDDKEINISLEDVVDSESAAIKGIGDAFFLAPFEKLSELERQLIIALAGARRENCDVTRVAGILGVPRTTAEQDILEHAERLYEKGILKPLEAVGSAIQLRFASEVYRRWAEIRSQSLAQDALLPRLDSVLDEIATRAHGDIVIAGEDVAAFGEFKKIVEWDTRRWRPLDIKFERFPHSDFFDALPPVFLSSGSPAEQPILREMVSAWESKIQDSSLGDAFNLLGDIKAIEQMRCSAFGEGRCFSEFWEKADLIAIPHYMLGYASAKGIVSFEEALRQQPEGEEYCKRVRGLLSTYCMAFDETCTFQGEWVAVPHTVVSKVLYHRGGVDETLATWDDIFSKTETIDAKPLCEDKLGKLSLWYEWHMVLAASGAELFDRRLGEDRPTFSKDYQIFCEQFLESEEPDKGAVEQTKLYKALENFRRLVASQHPSCIGVEGWWDAQTAFDRSERPFFCFSGWSDCALGFSRQSDIDARPIPKFHSSNGAGAAKQSLEGWVIVIPDRPLGRRGAPTLQSKFSRRNAGVTDNDLARLAISFLRRDWQRQFHRQTGCSPLRTILSEEMAATGRGQSGQQKLIKLGSIVQSSIFESTPKGKSLFEYERMRAELLLISALIYRRSEDRIEVVNSSNLFPRLATIWRDFHKALESINDEEIKCHSSYSYAR